MSNLSIFNLSFFYMKLSTNILSKTKVKNISSFLKSIHYRFILKKIVFNSLSNNRHRITFS